MEPGDRLRLVALAIADVAPNARLRRVDEPAIVEVTVETRLVHRVERAKAHRNGWELPKCRETTRMRIRRQAVTTNLATEVIELLVGQAAFEKRTRVHTRRGVTLDVHLVAAAAVALPAEEVIEPDLVERRGRGVRRQVTAEAIESVVGAIHHGDGVPAHVRADA